MQKAVGATSRQASHMLSVTALISGSTFAVCYFRLFIFPHVPVLPGGDQLGFAAQGARIVAGQLPYRDYFQIVPPGTDLVYAFLLRAFGVWTWIPGLVMACLAATVAMLVTLVSGRVMQGLDVAMPGVLIAGFILFSSLDATHHWFSTIVAMAAMMVLLDGSSNRHVAGAGALSGLTACFTQTKGAVVLAAFVAYIIWQSRQIHVPGKPSRRCLLLCGAAATVFGLANAYFIFAAGIRQWLYCVVLFPLLYYPALPWNNWRVVGQDLAGDGAVWRWIPFPLLYAVPFVYVVFFLHLRNNRKRDQTQNWDQLLLIALTGTAMFLAVASSPSVERLSTVSPPAMILLVWLLGRFGRTAAKLKIVLGVGGIAVAVAGPIRAQTRSWSFLDLPAGRTAFKDVAGYEEYRWVLGHTHPGQFFFGLPMYIPFRMRDPAAIEFYDGSEYTRPEQVAALVQALEERQVPLLILGVSKKYPFDTTSPRLAPFRDYLFQKYRLIKIFATGNECWGRIGSWQMGSGLNRGYDELSRATP